MILASQASHSLGHGGAFRPLVPSTAQSQTQPIRCTEWISITVPCVLFALPEPGYFRFYGSTIVELERRGWDVSLVYDKPQKRGVVRTVPADAGERVRSVGALPHGVSPSAKALRIAVDCIRYLEPAFTHAKYLRRRAEQELPPAFAFIKRIDRLPRIGVSALIGFARGTERILPVEAAMREFLKRVQPDVIVVSPLVIVGGSGVQQTELLKAAHALGICTIVTVASWDHLTSKGLIRVVPDAVIVWNDIQAKEAERLHRIPRRRIHITGAPPLDRWFDRSHSDEVESFRRKLGVEDHRRILLWVGSSRNMAPGDSEPKFVQRWLAALRASSCADVRNGFVIIRPHPTNIEPWRDVDFGDRNVVVYPTSYADSILLSESDVDTFWHSLLVSIGVVGINTTAMIEAAIVRRPVFSVRDAAFEHSQQQTLHFAYLSAAHGGCTVVSDDLTEHVSQIEQLFSGTKPDLAAADEFVRRFVRPLGMSTRATTHLCDAIERVVPTRGPDTMPARPSDSVTIGR